MVGRDPTFSACDRRPFCTWWSAFFFLRASLTRAKSSRSAAQLCFSRSLASANSLRSVSLQSTEPRV